MTAGSDQQIHLYLASNSPRRRELLAVTGLEFDLIQTQVDETPLPGEAGVEYVKRLAKSKVLAAADQSGKHGLIIAADTTVVNFHPGEKEQILGKPADKNEAGKMLKALRGHIHQVHTAISILNTSDLCLQSDLCTTDVPMRGYSDAEIETYIASGDPLDKAGAYAIQHTGFHPVLKLEGCFANVMGLPLCHLTRTLKKFGCLPLEDVPLACQAALDYRCPVYRQILSEEIQDYT